MVIGEFPQFQFGADGDGVGKVGVDGGRIGVHRWFRGVIDDTTMNTLFDHEARLFFVSG